MSKSGLGSAPAKALVKLLTQLKVVHYPVDVSANEPILSRSQTMTTVPLDTPAALLEVLWIRIVDDRCANLLSYKAVPSQVPFRRINVSRYAQMM